MWTLFPLFQEPVVVQQAVSWVTVTLALIAIIPTTVGAIISGMVLLQSKRNAEVAAITEAKVDEVKKGNNANGDKLTEIHTLTNSNLSAVTEELKASNVQVKMLTASQAASNNKIEKLESLLEALVKTAASTRTTTNTSDTNSDKLDALKSQLTSVQSGSPPIPVKDDAVLAKLNDVVIGKLDKLQDTADNPVEKKD